MQKPATNSFVEVFILASTVLLCLALTAYVYVFGSRNNTIVAKK